MLLHAKNIEKTYLTGGKSLKVLDSVNIVIEKGQMLAIAGPSGAGKSTLLHILGGLEFPTRGCVNFDGVDIYKLVDRERSLLRNKRIGFVFQFFNLLSEFTAIENIALPALLNTKSTDSKKEIFIKARELLKAVGLTRRSDHRPSQLSGGEAQRVAIARALINDPDIVFCDEPTGNLDSENTDTVLDILRGLNKKKKQAFLMVTHNQALAKFADRVILIRDGMIKSVHST